MRTGQSFGGRYTSTVTGERWTLVPAFQPAPPSQLASLSQPFNYPTSPLSSFAVSDAVNAHCSSTPFACRGAGAVCALRLCMDGRIKRCHSRLLAKPERDAYLAVRRCLPPSCILPGLLSAASVPCPDLHGHQRWLKRARSGFEPVTRHLQLREAHQRLKMPRGCLYRSRWLPCCPAGPADYGCTHQL